MSSLTPSRRHGWETVVDVFMQHAPSPRPITRAIARKITISARCIIANHQHETVTACRAEASLQRIIAKLRCHSSLPVDARGKRDETMQNFLGQRRAAETPMVLPELGKPACPRAPRAASPQVTRSQHHTHGMR